MQKRFVSTVTVRTLKVEKVTNVYVPVLKSVIVSSRPIHWSTFAEKLAVILDIVSISLADPTRLLAVSR